MEKRAKRAERAESEEEEEEEQGKRVIASPLCRSKILTIQWRGAYIGRE